MDEESIENLLRRVFCRVLGCHQSEGKLQAEWLMTFGGVSLSFVGEFMAILKDNEGPVGVRVKAWRDARGKKAKVDPNTPVTFTSDDENLIKVSQDANGNSQLEVGALDGVDADENGVIGTATITATADADLGDGVRPVVAVGSVTVTAGDAQVGDLEIDSPTPPTP